MTQQRIVAAREHRRQPARLLAEADVTDGIDAAVHTMQVGRAAPVVDGVLADLELPARNDAVLRARQVSDLMGGGRIAAHMTA